jgi:hypothetical protein
VCLDDFLAITLDEVAFASPARGLGVGFVLTGIDYSSLFCVLAKRPAGKTWSQAEGGL